MSTAAWHLKYMQLFKGRQRSLVSTSSQYYPFIPHCVSLPSLAAKGNSNHLLKNTAKRRRSKAQIAEDKEREAKRRTIDQERIDEIAALKAKIEDIAGQARQAVKNEDALFELMKEGKVSVDDNKNLEVVYDSQEQKDIAESFKNKEKEDPNFSVG
jgi:hypothetical protein